MKGKLPVLFTIHGGGFMLGSSDDDDDWNALYANQHHSLVVSLNYGKAPANPFPGPIHDCEELFLAVIDDDSLPISKEEVSMAGWSAGGNLCLAVSQLPSIKPHLSAIVALYPWVDLSCPLNSQEKASMRRCKPELGGFRAKEKGVFFDVAHVFDWSYNPAGEEAARNPLMSPIYASREALPNQVFVIGCELDTLAYEGERLINYLAGHPEPNGVVGQASLAEKGELVLHNERFHFDICGTDGSRYKWLLVPDTVHGFDHRMMGSSHDREFLCDAEIKKQKVITMIGEWILNASPPSHHAIEANSDDH